MIPNKKYILYLKGPLLMLTSFSHPSWSSKKTPPLPSLCCQVIFRQIAYHVPKCLAPLAALQGASAYQMCLILLPGRWDWVSTFTCSLLCRPGWWQALIRSQMNRIPHPLSYHLLFCWGLSSYWCALSHQTFICSRSFLRSLKCACVIPRAGMDTSIEIFSFSTALFLLHLGFVCFLTLSSIEIR